MYKGFYINLASNETRRAALTRHLQEVGAADRYQHVDAVNGRAVASQHPTKLDPGNLGLLLSHEKILQQNTATDCHLHIIEDDAIFCKNAVTVFETMLNCADTQLAGWDILFTDVFVQLNLDVFRLYAEKVKLHAETHSYSLLDLHYIDFACTSSMFINRASVGKYYNLLAGKWAVGLPIDIYLRGLVRHGHLKAYVVVPFPTTVSRHSHDSDIRGSVDRSRKVNEVVRQSFFVEADRKALLADIQELMKGNSVSLLAAIFLNAQSFAVSDQWVPF
jgi:GR25 family glycosyltransferase involved in LPS biosynthesis